MRGNFRAKLLQFSSCQHCCLRLLWLQGLRVCVWYNRAWGDVLDAWQKNVRNCRCLNLAQAPPKAAPRAMDLRDLRPSATFGPAKRDFLDLIYANRVHLKMKMRMVEVSVALRCLKVTGVLQVFKGLWGRVTLMCKAIWLYLVNFRQE